MTILKALKNFITKSGGSTKAGTIAEAIRDLPTGVNVEALSVTENGTYTAEDGKAYTPVVVNVPLPTGPYIEETYDSNGYLIGAVLHGYTNIRANAFQACSDLTLISLPSGLTSIGNYAFASCANLALTSLPSGLTSIGTNAFQYCSMLALTSLPSGLTTIGNNAFIDCTGLTSLTFEGKPTSINSTAFSNCTNLTTINVPWAENAVAGAPWGATNATINYNYTPGA